MNVTATLFGQMITFVIFVWFIKAYLWEPLTKAMEDRTNKISEGLASAELGEKRIEEANIEYKKIVDEAKQKASDVITLAQQQSGQMIEEAKTSSKKEAEKISDMRKAVNHWSLLISFVSSELFGRCSVIGFVYSN